MQLRHFLALAVSGLLPAITNGQREGDIGPAATKLPADPSREVVVVGHPPHSGSLAKAPPHCVRRPGDPADLVPVHDGKTDQRVIAPDKHGVLKWQGDREPVLGPAVWQRAGTAMGQYVFRVPVEPLPLCIGATVDKPSGWAQLRRIEKVTPDMAGHYLHFSALVAARDAQEIRFWLVAGASGGRVMGGDTHTAALKGTFGWKMADVIIGPVPREADHISYGFLLWGKGDVWIADPELRRSSRSDVSRIPSLPTSLRIDPITH